MSQSEVTARHILPTRHIVEEMIINLSSMTVANYSLEELISFSIVALEEEDCLDDHIQEFSTSVGRLTRLDQVLSDANDHRILCEAWTKFTYQLSYLYKRLRMWDDNGFASYYFAALTGYDIILSEKPALGLPRG